MIDDQAEFEERMTCTLDTQLKSLTTWIEQQAQELREETQHLREVFDKEFQAVRQDFSARLGGLNAECRETAGCSGRPNEAPRQRKRRD
jgi:hypothetical protein